MAVPKLTDEVTHEVVSDLHDDRSPSAGVTQLDPLASGVDNERASYQRTLNCVLQWNRLSVPVPQRETTFSGQLFQHCQEVIPEERHPALPQSELLSSAVRTVNNAIRGVAQFPSRGRECFWIFPTHKLTFSQMHPLQAGAPISKQRTQWELGQSPKPSVTSIFWNCWQ